MVVFSLFRKIDKKDNWRILKRSKVGVERKVKTK